MTTELWNAFVYFQGREPTTDEKMKIVKDHRNRLLIECDWTQLPDAVLTGAERTAWQDYRQALRDIPQTYPNPDDVVFPVRPQ